MKLPGVGKTLEQEGLSLTLNESVYLCFSILLYIQYTYILYFWWKGGEKEREKGGRVSVSVSV